MRFCGHLKCTQSLHDGREVFKRSNSIGTTWMSDDPRESVTLLIQSVPQLLTQAFEEGGAAVGTLFDGLGQVAEDYAGQVLR